jgi:phosphate transport system permease protein
MIGYFPVSRKASQKIGFGLIAMATVLVVAPVIYILIHVVIQGSSAIDWEFLSESPSQAGKAGGILPAIVGTFYLMIGTLVLALPVGVMAGIYLAEYAPENRLTSIINITIVNLAGVPSIVYGLFGLGVFVLTLDLGMSLLSAGLTLSCQALAMIITTSRESILTVPDDLKQGSLAMGVTRLQTIRHIVLPQARPGIITGAVLAISRAAGETAPILVVGAAFFLPGLPQSPSDQFMALPYHLYTVAAHVPGMPKDTVWGVALVLLTVVLFFNVLATILRIRARKRRFG